MTDDNLHPPHRSERGWRHEPQPRMIERPVSLWRRLDPWYLALIAACLCGAAVCAWGMLYGATEAMAWLLGGLFMIVLALLSRESQR